MARPPATYTSSQPFAPQGPAAAFQVEEQEATHPARPGTGGIAAYARLAVMQQRRLDDHPDVLKDRTALRDRQLRIARQVLQRQTG